MSCLVNNRAVLQPGNVLFVRGLALCIIWNVASTLDFKLWTIFCYPPNPRNVPGLALPCAPLPCCANAAKESIPPAKAAAIIVALPSATDIIVPSRATPLRCALFRPLNSGLARRELAGAKRSPIRQGHEQELSEIRAAPGRMILSKQPYRQARQFLGAIPD